jgi:ribosome-associated translation inhibitor RaiA
MAGITLTLHRNTECTAMQIKVNTDNHINGNMDLKTQAKSIIEKSLDRYSRDITRVEVHLSDENGPKGNAGPGDKRCLLEIRMRGIDPLAFTEFSDNIDAALVGAVDKAQRTIRKTLDKRRGH